MKKFIAENWEKEEILMKTSFWEEDKNLRILLLICKKESESLNWKHMKSKLKEMRLMETKSSDKNWEMKRMSLRDQKERS